MKKIHIYYETEFSTLLSICNYLRTICIESNKSFYFRDQTDSKATPETDLEIIIDKIENYNLGIISECDTILLLGGEKRIEDETSNKNVIYVPEEDLKSIKLEGILYSLLLDFIYINAIPFCKPTIIIDLLSGSKLNSFTNAGTFNESEKDLFPAFYEFIVNDPKFSKYDHLIKNIDLDEYYRYIIRKNDLTKFDKTTILNIALFLGNLPELIKRTPFHKNIFIVRDPYIVSQKIKKVQKIYYETNNPNIDQSIEEIGNFVLKTFEYQYYNVEKYKENCILLKCEEMENQEQSFVEKINNLLEMKIDISLLNTILSRTEELEFIVEDFSTEEREILKQIFYTKKEIFDFFGYDI